MSNQTKSKPQKPGERIAAEMFQAQVACAEKANAELHPHLVGDEWIAFLNSDEGADVAAGIANSALQVCIMRELDREAARRAKWEEDAAVWMNNAGRLLAAIAKIPAIAEVLAVAFETAPEAAPPAGKVQ